MNINRMKRIITYTKRGHSAYFSYILSMTQFVTIIYMLLINKVPILTTIFPNIFCFAIIFLITYTTITIYIGWQDYRRGLVETENLLNIKANPLTKDSANSGILSAKAFQHIINGDEENAKKCFQEIEAIWHKWTFSSSDNPTNREVQKHWEKTPVLADLSLEERNARFPNETKFMLSGLNGKQTALVEGSGSGFDLVNLNRMVPYTVGIDYSKNQLETSIVNIRKYGVSPFLCLADVENLPFRENTFDHVNSIGVLHHIENTVKAVKEIRRTLRPLGNTVSMFYRKKHPSIVYHILKIKEKYDFGCPIVKFYTKEELAELFFSFKILNIKAFGGIPHKEETTWSLYVKAEKNKPFSIVLPVKDEVEYMKKSLPLYLKLEPDELVLCLDDPCLPILEEIARREIEKTKTKLTIVKVPKDPSWGFHQAHVRRKGYLTAEHDTILTGDVDILVTKNIMEGINLVGKNNILAASFFRLRPLNSLGNILRCMSNIIRMRLPQKPLVGLYWLHRPYYLDLMKEETLKKIFNGEDTLLQELIVNSGKYDYLFIKKLGAKALPEATSNEDLNWRQFQYGLWFAGESKNLSPYRKLLKTLVALRKSISLLYPQFLQGYLYGLSNEINLPEKYSELVYMGRNFGYFLRKGGIR